MSTEADLVQIAQSMQAIESRFISSESLGLYLNADDEAEFKRLAVEAKALLDSELGRANDFSSNLFHAINCGAGGFLGGPSRAAVKAARAVVQGGINQIRRRPTQAAALQRASVPSYVDTSRLAELRSLSGPAWDATRLVRLAEELNFAHSHRCHMSVAMLVRAITDHVPPIFACKIFAEVANNFAGARSFRGSMQNLNVSLRNIADAHLHVQIRKSEILPTEGQVDFRADLDVLLAEVVRLLRDAS